MRTPIMILSWTLAGGVGCGFQPGATTASSDAASDGSFDGSGIPASCNELHTTNPALPSGMYMIDPDGSGGDASFSVTCDMTVEGGGWTIIFFAPSANITTAPMMYTASTPRLLNDAQTVLLAYRNAVLVTLGDYATFDLPGFWRLDTPFDYSQSDLPINVSVHGATPVSAMLRYGSDDFDTTCADPWSAATSLGRICIVGTTAPFFNGFQDPGPDHCSNSVSDWNSVACTNDIRFSIAVR